MTNAMTMELCFLVSVSEGAFPDPLYGRQRIMDLHPQYLLLWEQSPSYEGDAEATPFLLVNSLRRVSCILGHLMVYTYWLCRHAHLFFLLTSLSEVSPGCS